MDGYRLEEVKGCLEDYLRQRGLPLRKAFRCLSPDHEDRHPSMHYNPRAANVHCFACGATYDLLDLVGMDYGIPDFPGRYRKACALFGIEPQPFGLRPGFPEDGSACGRGDAGPCVPAVESLPFAALAVPDRLAELEALRRRGDGCIDYFVGRGISRESVAAHGLFQLEGRAYFPVMNGARCTGWCARAVDEDTAPRYKNSAGSLGIWNIDRLAGGRGTLYVTEGIVDAILLEQQGCAAVALCGSQNGGKLLARLREFPCQAAGWRYVLCGDPDSAGRRMNGTLGEGLDALGLPWDVLPLTAADGDIGQLYQRDRSRLTALLKGPPVERRPLPGTSAAAGLDEFFAHAARRRGQGAVSTGFAALDKQLDGGLYPGLYVLGAVSSLGKTSLALQMADAISAGGRDVLFFSLEQSSHELMAKSLSRLSAQLDAGGRSAFTARQLLVGAVPQSGTRAALLGRAGERYRREAARLFVREGGADVDPAAVCRAAAEHAAAGGGAPVVIVDYLQILAPADPRATDKQNVDRAVVALKRLSRDLDIPVLCISSFNRENYRAAASMESCKESGAVEYSADVLLALQLQGAGERGLDVNRAKLQDPRQLELVVLKNRNGIPWARVPLRYSAKYNLFEEGKGVGACGGGRDTEAGQRLLSVV